ncbi:MAG TPA: hypothetical protein VEL71_06645 [Candidatus Dormibacteraeota bacterium]|nr:hypothetical protein [Candidatus Dormibacteraeota bacterium]
MVLFCALKRETRPDGFNWRDPLWKISKAVASRDAKRVFGRVDLKEEVRTSRHIIQNTIPRGIFH